MIDTYQKTIINTTFYFYKRNDQVLYVSIIEPHTNMILYFITKNKYFR